MVSAAAGVLYTAPVQLGTCVLDYPRLNSPSLSHTTEVGSYIVL